MKEQLKSFLNEEQDPKAIEKISGKLQDLLMKNEEVGYIGVQKKPAINVFPDSIVLTNRRIIMCRPKNLGLSMDFVDYAWEDISGTTVKENILGSEFSFATKTDLQVSIDYLPKAQARKIYTFAKEQLELLKNPQTPSSPEGEAEPVAIVADPFEDPPSIIAQPFIEEVETEEVTDFADMVPVAHSGYRDEKQHPEETPSADQRAESNNDELFVKLQNYKKLLDNGLILQGEYDRLKAEILSKM